MSLCSPDYDDDDSNNVRVHNTPNGNDGRYDETMPRIEPNNITQTGKNVGNNLALYFIVRWIQSCFLFDL